MYPSLQTSLKAMTGLTLLVSVTACQLTPQSQETPVIITPVETAKPQIRQENGVTITPYPDDGIKREKLPVDKLPVESPKPQVKQQIPPPLPAYENLIQQTKTAYLARQWETAERLALQTQRIAPQSAENYYYLSRIALHKAQYTSAEALAQRGLSYAKTTAMKKLLWSTLADIGRAQKNAALTLEAQKEILKLGS